MPVSSPFSRASPAVGVLLRNYRAGNGRGKMEAKFSGLTLKVANGSLFEEPFVSLLTSLDVSLAVLKHAIEDPGEFMGASVYCRRGSETNLDASDESSDGGFALHGALSGQAQSNRSAIGIFSWFAGKDFASADAMVRSDIQPGAKMFFAGPAAHIQTDFRKNSLHRQQIQSG